MLREMNETVVRTYTISTAEFMDLLGIEDEEEIIDIAFGATRVIGKLNPVDILIKTERYKGFRDAG